MPETMAVGFDLVKEVEDGGAPVERNDWTPRVLPIIAGHLALDFANSVDDPQGPERYDHAGAYPELAAWAERVGVLDPATRKALIERAARNPLLAAAALSRAHELRDALNDLFGALADGVGTAPRHWPALRPFVARAWAASELFAPASATTARTGAEASQAGSETRPWRWVADELDWFLHPIALSAADLLADERPAQLKRCARCPWLFLDGSRNHSRRWCDMDDCGRAAKIEKIMAKRAAARRAGIESHG